MKWSFNYDEFSFHYGMRENIIMRVKLRFQCWRRVRSRDRKKREKKSAAIILDAPIKMNAYCVWPLWVFYPFPDNKVNSICTKKRNGKTFRWLCFFNFSFVASFCFKLRPVLIDFYLCRIVTELLWLKCILLEVDRLPVLALSLVRMPMCAINTVCPRNCSHTMRHRLRKIKRKKIASALASCLRHIDTFKIGFFSTVPLAGTRRTSPIRFLSFLFVRALRCSCWLECVQCAVVRFGMT